MSAVVVEELSVTRTVIARPRVRIEVQLVTALLGDAGVVEEDVD